MFYLMVTSGISMNLHYCGGKLKKVSFFHNVTEKGCCGTKKKSKGCCKDKKSFHKVKDNHKLSNCITLKPNNDSYSATIIPTQFTYTDIKSLNKIELHNHAPPVIYDNPLYLKYRVLLI